MFGYGLECIGTFANIYCDKSRSWGNAGKKGSGIGLLETTGCSPDSVGVNGFGTGAAPADFESVSLVAYGN